MTAETGRLNGEFVDSIGMLSAKRMLFSEAVKKLLEYVQPMAQKLRSQDARQPQLVRNAG
jgi:hypothetical protein